MSDLRSERGQAAVLTVIFLVAILGAVALVLDVGSWFREQRDTQVAADAAALAAAQELPYDTALADARVSSYLAKNRGGTAQVTYSSKWATNDTITVAVERKTPGVFSKLFGIDSVDVGARSTARAGGLQEARWVAPITVNEKHPELNCDVGGDGKPIPCFGQPTAITLADLHKPGSSNAAGSFGLINLDRNAPGNIGAEDLGAWIRRGFDQYMPLGLYRASPSTEFNSSHIQNALQIRTGDDLLFPIYRSITGTGQTARFDVIGWVGFNVTGKQIQGDKGKVFGAFTKVIWEGIQSTSGSNLNFGTRAIALIE